MAGATKTDTVPNVLTDLGFKELSQGVSLYSPVNDVTESSDLQRGPTLIILCSWAFALPKHIAKYLKPHQDRFPTASILLVQNIIANALWRPDKWQMSFFQPAAAVVQAHIQLYETPRVLLHAFSNGGSHAAVQLSQACRETCGGMRMPVDAIIFDSCPGQPRFGPTIAALTGGIPSKSPVVKGIGKVLVSGAIVTTALCDLLNISEPAAWKLYRKLNDPSDVFLFKQSKHEELKPVSRSYIYSKADDMIMAEDVEGHARIAREKITARGFEVNQVAQAVSLEEFEGSAHVNHIKNEGERYWRIIGSTWARAF